ncbi:MAG: prolyl oligopeptidase family serine peptidase [Fimbriimonas sp.]
MPLFPLIVTQTSPTLVREAAVAPVRSEGRVFFRTDPIEMRLVRGEALDGAAWEPVKANDEGVFSGRAFSSGYARVRVPSAQARTVLLEAQGASYVYVNGEPRAGDVYSTGYVSLPVQLRAGDNELVFRVQRGRLRVALVEAPKPVSLDARDATIPDRLKGTTDRQWGALVVRNATDAALKDLRIETSSPGGRAASAPLPTVPGMTVRKVPIPFGASTGADVTVRLLQGRRELDRVKVAVRVRGPQETRRVTFVSEIDGSVQYYGLNPAQAPNPSALILSLHGASVEAMGQADAYSGKRWANLVAATNRRPYGFDWEDWGRMDALEVLDLAKRTYPHDRARVYLTGHSMGGHGTWHLGVHYPDLFGAIAPSAGWISSFTYAGARRVEGDDPLRAILRRAGNVGDTAALVGNLAPVGVYILHGDADDNVPPTQARDMAELLKPFHRDYTLKEVPGQNHWWDLSDEAGADAVDYAPMMDFLARHARPATDQVREVDFRTFNPEVSARCHWATIESQIRSMELSEVKLRVDPYQRRFVGTTWNVEQLALDLSPLMPGAAMKVELDGQTLTFPRAGESPLRLIRRNDRWALGVPIPAEHKNPRRAGPFRLGFDQRMQFVYGTRGTAEENRWAYAKARYDAESWWYRGNGAVDVVADRDFDPLRERDRSVVLYGNADTNAAWNGLLGASPVQVRRTGVRVGTRDVAGEDLACLFVRPRAGSALASVAVVAGTGMTGLRFAGNLPYLQPMLGVPDLLVVGADSLETGVAGVRVAGFFGNDWSLDKGDIAFRP